MSKTKIFDGKKYYLLTSQKGVERTYAYSKAKDQREMGYIVQEL